jgi:predicted PurR-regulated permease PerM
MDAPAPKREMNETVSHAHALAEAFTAKRDRLLAALTLIAGIGLVVALPFALRAGAEFFLPVTAALVIAIALVPMLEWFERHGCPRSLQRHCACCSS